MYREKKTFNILIPRRQSYRLGLRDVFAKDHSIANVDNTYQIILSSVELLFASDKLPTLLRCNGTAIALVSQENQKCSLNLQHSSAEELVLDAVGSGSLSVLVSLEYPVEAKKTTSEMKRKKMVTSEETKDSNARDEDYGEDEEDQEDEEEQDEAEIQKKPNSNSRPNKKRNRSDSPSSSSSSSTAASMGSRTSEKRKRRKRVHYLNDQEGNATPIVAYPSGLCIQELFNDKDSGNSKKKKSTRGDNDDDDSITNIPQVVPNEKVRLGYRGILESGYVFDEGMITFRVGEHKVIKGLELGVVGMREGDSRNLRIPPHLGYGKQRFDDIPKNSVLIFEIDLLRHFVSQKQQERHQQLQQRRRGKVL